MKFYDENTAEVLPEVPEENSSEVVSSDYIVKDSELTDVELFNRVILQLQYNEDMQAYRDRVLQEKLDILVDSVSQNDVPADEIDGVEDVVTVFRSSPLSASESISNNDVRQIADNLSALVSETVSQNDIFNTDLMHKDMKTYTVSESFLAMTFILIFVLCTITLFKK